jgi:hypothetical protein
VEDHHRSLSTRDHNGIPLTEDNNFLLLGAGIRARILGSKVEDKINIKEKIKTALLPQNKVEDKVNIKVKIKNSRLYQNVNLEI